MARLIPWFGGARDERRATRDLRKVKPWQQTGSKRLKLAPLNHAESNREQAAKSHE
jgi:hypothetical protein